MSYERMEREGYIKKVRPRPKQIRNYLATADRDLKAARHNLGINNDWAFAIACNAVLQTCLALMLLKGYRPAGAEHHKTVFRFTKIALGKEYEAEMDFFDQMRRKRHRVVYGIPGLISKHEAEKSLGIAEKFVNEMREKLSQELDQ
jgi:uncharacterized protein (UPF0332 family)